MRDWLYRWVSGEQVSCHRCEGWSPMHPIGGFWHDLHCWGLSTALWNFICPLGESYRDGDHLYRA